MASLRCGRTGAAISCLIVAFAACSGGARPRSVTGPQIFNAQVNPRTIQLNSAMQPESPHEIVVDVQDLTSEVEDVRVRFETAPFEFQMRHVAGTTWRTVIPAEQLRRMGVSGKTMEYRANILARSADGEVAVTENPIKIKVKAPAVDLG